MIAFNGWNMVTPVQEVQTVTISSNCFSLGTCDYASYGLVYGAGRTGFVKRIVVKLAFLYRHVSKELASYSNMC